jgi:hypothetical protein
MASYIPLKEFRQSDADVAYTDQVIQQIPQGLRDKLEVRVHGDLHSLRISVWIRPIGRNDLAREHVIWTYNNGEPPRRITIPDDFIAFFSALS